MSAAMATGGPGHEARVPDSPQGDDALVDSEASDGDGAPSGGEPIDGVPAWLQPVLRILAETQLELATKSGERRPRTAVTNVKLEEFAVAARLLPTSTAPGGSRR